MSRVHSCTLSWLRSCQEEVLAALPVNRRVEMYSNPPRGLVPFPLSLSLPLRSSFRVTSGAAGWCEEATSRVRTDSGSTVQTPFDPVCICELSRTLSFTLCVLVPGKRGSFYDSELKKSTSLVCKWLFFSQPIPLFKCNSLYARAIMGNCFSNALPSFSAAARFSVEVF